MSSYLIRLAGRSLGLIDVLRPRTISMFEPLPDDGGHTFEDNFWLSALFNDPISDSAEPGESRADSNRQAPKIQMQPAAFVPSPSPQQNIPFELGREETKNSPSSEVSPITPSIRQTPLKMDQIPKCSPSGPSCTSSCERLPNEPMGRENNPGSTRVKVHPYEAKTGYAGDSPNPIISAQGILGSSNGIDSKDRDGSVRISGSESPEAHPGPSAGSSDSLRSSSVGSLKNPSEADPGAAKRISIPKESDRVPLPQAEFRDPETLQRSCSLREGADREGPAPSASARMTLDSDPIFLGVGQTNDKQVREDYTDRSYLSRESNGSPSNISSMRPGDGPLKEKVPISEELESNAAIPLQPSRTIFGLHPDGGDRSKGVSPETPLESEISIISSAIFSVKHVASCPEPENRRVVSLAGQRYDKGDDNHLGQPPLQLSRSSPLSSSKEPIRSVEDGVLQRQGPDVVAKHEPEPVLPGIVSPLIPNKIVPSSIGGDDVLPAGLHGDEDKQISRSSSMRPSILASAGSQRRVEGCNTQDCPTEIVDADWDHPLSYSSSFKSKFHLPKREDTNNETTNNETTNNETTNNETTNNETTNNETTNNETTNNETTNGETTKGKAMLVRAAGPPLKAHARQIPSKSDPDSTEAMAGAATGAVVEKPDSGVRRIIADLGRDSPAQEQEYFLPNRRSSEPSPEAIFFNHHARLPHVKALIKRAAATRSKIPESGTSSCLESFKETLGETGQTAKKRRQGEPYPLSPSGYHSIRGQGSPLYRFGRALPAKGLGRKRKAEIFQDRSLSVGSIDPNSIIKSPINKSSNVFGAGSEIALTINAGLSLGNRLLKIDSEAAGSNPPETYYSSGYGAEVACENSRGTCDHAMGDNNKNNNIAKERVRPIGSLLTESTSKQRFPIKDIQVSSKGGASDIVNFSKNMAADRPANASKKIADQEGILSSDTVWIRAAEKAKKKRVVARMAHAEEMSTTVHITVGRIEIRAPALNGSPHTVAGRSSRPRSTSSRLTLDSYLKQRSKG